MNRRQKTTAISLAVAVRKSGLREEVVQECVARSLVQEPLTAADLAELRRVRRLSELGINLAGIEVILHMRRRILALQARPGSGHGVEDSAWEARWQRLLPWKSDE